MEAALGALPNKVIEDAHVLIYRNLSQHNLTTYYKDRKWNGLGRGYSNGAYPFDHSSNVSIPSIKIVKRYSHNPLSLTFAYSFCSLQPCSQYTWYDTDLVILILRECGTRGNQYAVECRTAYCGDGCQPKLAHPIDLA